MTKSANYILNVGEAAAKRLILQNEIYQTASIDLLNKAGLSNALKVMDVGCGVGAMTSYIAKTIGDTGLVVGVDYSEEQISIAKQKLLEQNIANAKFLATDIYKLASHFSAEFDIAYMRLFLGHLPRPKEALQQIIACVKYDGKIVAEEMNHSKLDCYPTTSVFEDFKSLVLELQNKKGVADIAHSVYHLFKTCGLKNVKYNLFQPVLDTVQKRQLIVMIFNELSIEMVKEKLINESEQHKISSELKDLMQQDVFVAYMRNTQIYGTK